ncbi:MAG TPA: tetratricopeptide repeat protein, partial [Pseudonocardiaceae bacterium]
VSSRHTLPIPGARRLELDVLPTPDAIAVLTQATTTANPDDTRTTTEPEAAAELARLCGGLPLALRIIAELLADQPDQPVAAMVANLSAERNRLGELAYGDSIAVRAAFDASYRHLPTDQARLFRLMSLNPGPHIALDAAAALIETDETTTRHLLNALRRAHLILPGYRMHDLLHLYANEHCTEDERAPAIDRLLRHYLDAASAAGAHIDPEVPANDRASRFADQTQALTWLDAQRPNLIASVALAAETGHDDVARDIPLQLLVYVGLRQHSTDWMITYEYALAAARRLGDRRKEAVCLNMVGTGHNMAKRFDEAEECFLLAGDLCRELGDRYGQAGALDNLGRVLVGRGRYADAIDSHRQALELYRELGDRYGEALALATLGNSHKHSGQLAEALECYQQAVSYFAEIGNARNHGLLLSGIALLRNQQGELDAAETAWLESIPLLRASGHQHILALTLNNLGNNYAHQARFDEAERFLRTATALCQEIGDHLGEGRVTADLGGAFVHAGRVPEALECFQRSIAIFQKIQATDAIEFVRRIIAKLTER